MIILRIFHMQVKRKMFEWREFYEECANETNDNEML